LKNPIISVLTEEKQPIYRISGLRNKYIYILILVINNIKYIIIINKDRKNYYSE